MLLCNVVFDYLGPVRQKVEIAMGWMFCGEDENGREIGYGVSAVCDEDGCENKIDRGLSYVCGSMHMDSETCHRYFCSSHLISGCIADECGQLCHLCFAYDMNVSLGRSL